MKKTWVLLFFVLVLTTKCGDKEKSITIVENDKLEKFDPVLVTKSNPTKVWAHYMPWFEDKTTSDNGEWGDHWTMANKNPDIIDEDGKRQIAAHYYPLIGPYASSDVDVLEYHFLLMKYSGIDGILIDWYGTRDLYDYASNGRNTEVIVSVLEKVGLEFAIVYEDQTLRDEMEGDAIRVSQAVSDMQYLEEKFFKKDNYIRIEGKPLLMVFGPQIINAPSDWDRIFKRMSEKPLFFTLYDHSSSANNSEYKNAVGEFIWVDLTSMEQKYSNKKNFEKYIGGAYPGFHDFYKEGGWGNTLLNIDHKNGETFQEGLEMAQEYEVDYLQLITWNDFGEGTMIEPTLEFQYSFLESTQRFTGVEYKKTNLETVYTYYQLKNQFKGKSKEQKKLTQIFYYLISLQEEKAVELMKELSK